VFVVAAGCCASSLVSGWQAVPVDTDPAVIQVRREIEGGALSAAERLATSAYARVADQSESVALVTLLESVIEAQLAFGNAKPVEALADANRVLRAKERLVGIDSLDTSRSLLLVANVHVFRGEFRAAVPLYERALAIRQRHLPPDDQEIADSLERLAFALVRSDTVMDGNRAERELNRAFAIRKALPEEATLRLASTLETYALRYRYSGRYGEALAAIDRSLSIRRQLAPDHPSIASALHIRGDILWLQGDATGAADSYREAIVMGENTLDPRHPLLVVLPRMLALTSEAFGNLPEARQLRQQAVDRARTLARCHPEATGVLSDLALSLKSEGDYVGAEKLYRRVLTERERCLGPIHSRTATTVFNLAELLYAMGDLVEAEQLEERAARDWAASVGPMHPYVALALDAQAQTVIARGDPIRAERLFMRALDIRRKSLASNHPDIAGTLVRLADLSDSLGNSQAALDYLKEAAKIYAEAQAATQPQLMSGLLMVRGHIEARRGDSNAARRSFVSALAERERMYGPSHPLAAETRAALATLEIREGHLSEALSNALTAEDIGRSHLRTVIRYLPERQALGYASKRPGALDLALSVAALQKTDAPRLVMSAVIESRGVVLDELMSRNGPTSAPSAQSDGSHIKLLKARQRYADLLVRTIHEPVNRTWLEDARREKDEAERAFAERKAGPSIDPSSRRVTLNEVEAELPDNGALVSFVTFNQTSPDAADSHLRKPIRRYGAFVARASDTQVVFLPLGRSDLIDRLIRQWRAEAGSPGGASAYRAAGAALRRAVWDPIETHLKDVTRIFIVPDDLLSIVNIAALPRRDGQFIAEGPASIHYLSTERDLLARTDDRGGRGLLAVGGPAFNADGIQSAIAADVRSGCDALGNIHFTDLPGSRREVNEISKLWPSRQDDPSAVLSGPEATETAVKNNLRGRRIVHLATHGFVLGTDCVPNGGRTRSVGGLAKKAAATKGLAIENPLLLSGLAFAGANDRRNVKPDQDDGILTAEEIAGLNLQGTEWAVLSACDTGLGEIKAGEGVFGLRRAFQIAGARTVIMSLWSVEDRSAMEWMRALYKGRLEKGLDTAEAVREASLTVLRQRRAKGLSTHPFYWAGFVAAGDWR
jgi:CHAT domain-containing protein/TolA-binding protein